VNRRRERSLLGEVPALAGGRAPACWQRKLASAARKHDLLPRACGWVKSLNSVAIKLRPGPLLGSCLADLAAGQAQPAEVFSEDAQASIERARPSRDSSNHARLKAGAMPIASEDAGHSQRRSRFQPTTKQPPLVADRTGQRQLRPSTSVTELPQQAAAGLLSRFATDPRRRADAAPAGTGASPVRRCSIGEIDSAAARPDRRSKPDAAATNSLSRRRPVPATPRAAHSPVTTDPQAAPDAPNGPNVPADPATSADSRRMLDRLSRQAARKLGLLAPLSAGVEDHVLHSQWSAPIAAPRISTETLKQRAMLAQFEAEPDKPRGASGEQQSQNGPARPGGSTATREPAAWPPGNHRCSPPVSPLAALPDGTAERWLAAPAIGPPVSGVSTEAMAGASSPNLSAAIAPELPPMLPPPEVGVPILPLATSSVQRGAREEAAAVEEDLDALATRIKLILDEQARRHGIDV
jgi:hypothetical protein